jgi:hypothetical protein
VLRIRTTAVKRNAFWVAFNLVSVFPLGFGTRNKRKNEKRTAVRIGSLDPRSWATKVNFSEVYNARVRRCRCGTTSTSLSKNQTEH